MPSAFESLREQLLRGGIGASHAGRYIDELLDHLDQLVREEEIAGRPSSEARARAMQRLGDAGVLADAMVARREFRTFSSRAPFAAYIVAPLAALVLVLAVLFVGLHRVGAWLQTVAAPSSSSGAWLWQSMSAVVDYGSTLAAAALGLAMAAKAVRQRAPVIWPLSGLVALAALGAAARFGLVPPMGGDHGELSFSFEPALLPRMTIDLGAMAISYGLLTIWQRQHAPGEVARRSSAQP